MPKHVKMMILEDCPYCKQAFEMMEELKTVHPEYRAVDIEVIEENREPEKIKGYQYWYVPTFFVDDVKVMEGVPSIELVEKMFTEALG
ncbi:MULTISPECIES: glutaredoxin family protein [Anaerotruncus]|uniref:glutaredoxin family protein n=1 Tax=Anaerotruncus TaxID=244127 RepID=UPI00082C0AE6|nr:MULTISPECIES: thioredoxin family protein [Anaerotruncus]RGX55792.1 thioredoxin [Anaerotruncus sp. AF02-27]